jgi:hypothetical protein
VEICLTKEVCGEQKMETEYACLYAVDTGAFSLLPCHSNHQAERLQRA